MKLSACRFVLALALCSVGAGQVGADVVYLKDGTVLNGRVIQSTKLLTDPATGQVLPVPAGDGVYAVYDGTRVVTFSRLQIDPTRGASGIDDTDVYANLLRLERTSSSKPFRKPPAGDVKGKLTFDDRGYRQVTIRTERGPVHIRQLLTFLSPYQMRVFSLEYLWSQNYLTAELDRELVKSLALAFPQIRDEKDPIEKRMRWHRFLVESKWYDEAAKDLDQFDKSLQKKHPILGAATEPLAIKARERLDQARERLRTLQAEQSYDHAERALNAGQLGVAQSFLAIIPRQGIDANLSIKVNTLRVKVDGLVNRFVQAQRFLRRLPDFAEGDCAEILCEAAGVLREELHPEALDRLEPFLNLAEQAERIAKAGGIPADKPEQLLARAVSGWLLGKESSDARPEVARRLWRARRMAADYIRTPLARDRAMLLERYEKNEPVGVDELARIIALLPPPAPDMPIPAGALRPISRKTDLPSPNHTGAEYQVLLPPEYRPGRPYPMLVALHDDNQNLTQILERYGYEAIRNGYILVAAEWGAGFGGRYGYNPEERQRVLDVIRDARLHYHIDSDRIFLSGQGEGGNAAWDIGLSHPDLFAGVVPIASDPAPALIRHYWPNAIHLPFYIVGGEYGSIHTRYMLKTMEDWINKGFPCLNVMYQGRGREWFGAELPTAFEWMGRRKRVLPVPELGRWPTGDSTALNTMRLTDNHHYWLSTDSIFDRYLIENKGSGNFNAARMQAIIRPGNEITVSTFGLRQVSIWLTPAMIDLTRPVSVKLTGYRTVERPKVFPPLKPDLSLMMEDFLERGDGSRLFIARLSIDLR